DRYITSRFLPDKAIDVVDEAGARMRLRSMTRPPDLKDLDEEIEKLNKEKEEAVAAQDFEQAAYLRDRAEKMRKKREDMRDSWKETSVEKGGTVDEDLIAETVSSITGVPLTRLEKGEAERLLNMEVELHQTVVSQDDAIKVIAKSVRRSRSGLKDPRRPMGCFMFLGPTGVGKTHLAKQLAKFMFGDEDALIQVDMSEYMEKHNASRLVGAPPGYVGYEEGGQLTERVRRRPYSVVLLDEVEKAHSYIFNMLLQIMEEGRLTDSFGRNIDFRNVILLMTSNIGAGIIKNQSSLGFKMATPDVDYQQMKAQLNVEVEKFFRPEFLNRLDDVIIFRSLTKENMIEILDIEARGIIHRLSEKGLSFEWTAPARDFLLEKGTNLEFGARPLRRALERYLEDPLAEEILKDTFEGKNHVIVKLVEDQIVFEAIQRESTSDSEVQVNST
ncbi:MAG: ATP-dependent Clp protease ATP-binding subunit, partial [Planctomycetes bacterium]|nr:ATP-dependent Clp protease ATP-binding subunit [Planctomycetota bacterium]